MPTDGITPDAQQLKALAHPLRVALLGLLRAEGPGTASTLADRLDVSSGLTSYHLRELARAGFVEEDASRGSGRQRWWKAAHELTSWDPADPATAAVTEQLVDRWERWRASVVATWRSSRAAWPPQWRRAAEQSDLLLRLTPDELIEVGEALRGVLEPWLERTRARRDGLTPVPEDAAFVRVFLTALPVADAVAALGAADELDALRDDGGSA